MVIDESEGSSRGECAAHLERMFSFEAYPQEFLARLGTDFEICAAFLVVNVCIASANQPATRPSLDNSLSSEVSKDKRYAEPTPAVNG